MKPIYDSNEENEYTWPKEAQKYVDGMTMRKFVHYIVIIAFSLCIAFIGRSCDSTTFYDSVVLYSSSPFLWVAFFLIAGVVSVMYLININKNHSFNTNQIAFSYTLMKTKLKKKFNVVDRFIYAILIILGIISIVLYLIEFFGFFNNTENSVLIAIRNFIYQINIIDLLTILYALISACVAAIALYPTLGLYKDRCYCCNMCNTFMITDRQESVSGIYATGSEEVTVAEVYDGATHVGSVKKNVGTNYVREHRVHYTHTCQNCGATHGEKITYHEKVD